MVFVWSARYEMGVPDIDAQHRSLVDVINEVFDVLSELESERIQTVLEKLDSYVSDHFALEAEYMKRTNYPGSELHQAAHAVFAIRIAELKSSPYNRKIVALRAGVILNDWLREHLLAEDRLLCSHIREFGVGTPIDQTGT